MSSIAAIEIGDNVVAIFTMFLALMIPIVAIFSKHQLKMTALLRQANSGEQTSEELRELKQIVTQQALTIDSLIQSQRILTEQLSGSANAENNLRLHN